MLKWKNVYIVKGKGKCRTLDIAPLCEGTSVQERSGMARIVDWEFVIKVSKFVKIHEFYEIFKIR